MAFLAYKRAGGECDDELLRVTSENGLFKNQARYLVEKQDMDLWAKVLTKAEGESEEPASRRALIEQASRVTSLCLCSCEWSPLACVVFGPSCSQFRLLLYATMCAVVTRG